MSSYEKTLARIEMSAKLGKDMTFSADQCAAIGPILRAAFDRYQDPAPVSPSEKRLWDACQQAEHRL